MKADDPDDMDSRSRVDADETSSLGRTGQVTGPGDGAMAAGIWIRNPRRTRTWAAIAVGWSAVVLSRLWAGGGSRGSIPLVEALSFATFYLGLAALGLVLARRVARSGVLIGPEAVMVRGPLRTHSVGLDAAGRFSPGLQGRGGNGTPCPMLERHDERPVGVWALGRRNVWFRYERLCEEVQPACDELNALVEMQRLRRRGHAPAGVD